MGVCTHLWQWGTTWAGPERPGCGGLQAATTPHPARKPETSHAVAAHSRWMKEYILPFCLHATSNTSSRMRHWATPTHGVCSASMGQTGFACDKFRPWQYPQHTIILYLIRCCHLLHYVLVCWPDQLLHLGGSEPNRVVAIARTGVDNARLGNHLTEQL